MKYPLETILIMLMFGAFVCVTGVPGAAEDDESAGGGDNSGGVTENPGGENPGGENPGGGTGGGGEGTDLLRATEGPDLLHGTDLGDTIAGLGGADTIHGGLGNDLLSTFTLDDLEDFNSLGTGDASQAYGGAGDDTIYAMNRGDLIYGGDGNDQIDIYATHVLVEGGDGDDLIGNGAFLSDMADNVTVHGDGGNDTISIYGTDLRLFGGDGNDVITVGDGDGAVVQGGAGDDILRYIGEGGSGGLFGGDGNDTLISTTASDFAGAGAGNRLSGGAGDDWIEVTYLDGSELIGGTGADTFVVGDAFTPDWQRDYAPQGIVMSDFNPAEDILIVRAPEGVDTENGMQVEIDTARNEVRLYFSTEPDMAADDPDTYVFDEPAIILQGLSSFDPAWLRIERDG